MLAKNSLLDIVSYVSQTYEILSFENNAKEKASPKSTGRLMDDEPVPVVYEEMIQNLEEKVRQYIRFQQHMKINFD